MDGEMGLAAALRAMAPDGARSPEEWAMFSALPDAPVVDAPSTRERIVDRTRRLVPRVRTGRTEEEGPRGTRPDSSFQKSGPSQDTPGHGIRHRRVVVTDPTFGTWIGAGSHPTRPV